MSKIVLKNSFGESEFYEGVNKVVLKTETGNKVTFSLGTNEKDVVIFDPYNNIIASYSKEDFLSLSEYPSAPVLPNLTFQEYNWNLDDAKKFVEENGIIDIGATYTTTSGLSEFDIELTPVTGLTVIFNLTGETDWGDGTIEQTTSNLSPRVSHTYSDYGKYTIKTNATSLRDGFLVDSIGAHNKTLVEARLSNKLKNIQYDSFRYCVSLISITIPNTILTIGYQAFDSNRSLKCLILPNGVTELGSGTISNNPSMNRISLPSSLNTVGRYFCNTSGLRRLIMPSSITTLNGTPFNLCTGMWGVETFLLPPNISISQIEGAVFSGCYNLKKIKFTLNIEKIPNYSFKSMYSCTIIDFSSLSNIPAIENTSNYFQDLNPLCKIVVPDNLYDEWIIATNWSAFANYIYKASDVLN